MKLMAQSAVHPATCTFLVFHGCMHLTFCRFGRSVENVCVCVQSKHIVIFDTLIKERKTC